MSDWIADTLIPTLLALFCLCCVAGIAMLIVDLTYYDRRAFSAITACEAKMLEPRRQAFSVNVVCVPIKTRQDTTTVNVNSK